MSKNDLNFLDHLEELRFRILKCLIALIICTILTYTYKSEIFEIVIHPIMAFDLTIQHLKVYDKFMALLKLSLYASLVLSFPIIIYQITAFVLPALYKNERKTYYITLSVVIVLFFLGAFLSYRYLTPITVKFLIDFDKDETKAQEKLSSFDKLKSELLSLQKKIEDKRNEIDISTENNGLRTFFDLQDRFNKHVVDYFDVITPSKLPPGKNSDALSNVNSNLTITDYIDWLIFFTAVMGLVFELPVVMIVLAMIGIVTDKTYSRIRPYALVIILIVAALIAPDVVSQIIIAIPIYLLYEIGIFGSYIIRKRKAKREKELGSTHLVG